MAPLRSWSLVGEVPLFPQRGGSWGGDGERGVSPCFTMFHHISPSPSCCRRSLLKRDELPHWAGSGRQVTWSIGNKWDGHISPGLVHPASSKYILHSGQTTVENETLAILLKKLQLVSCSPSKAVSCCLPTSPRPSSPRCCAMPSKVLDDACAWTRSMSTWC